MYFSTVYVFAIAEKQNKSIMTSVITGRDEIWYVIKA